MSDDTGCAPERVNVFEWQRRMAASDLNPTRKLLCWSLSRYASRDGSNAHPGVARLMADCGIRSDKTVRSHLKVLTELGWIDRVFRGSSTGRKALSDEYALTAPAGSKRSWDRESKCYVDAENTGNPDENTGKTISNSGSEGYRPPRSPHLSDLHHSAKRPLPHEPQHDESEPTDPDDYADPFEFLYDQLVMEVGDLAPDEESTLRGMASEGRNYRLVENTVRDMIRVRLARRDVLRARTHNQLAPWMRPYADDGEPSALVYLPDYDSPDPCATVPMPREASYDDEPAF